MRNEPLTAHHPPSSSFCWPAGSSCPPWLPPRLARRSTRRPARRWRRRITHVDTVAGVDWPDPYAWLRDDQRRNARGPGYLRAENAYTEAMTRHSRPLDSGCSARWWVI